MDEMRLNKVLEQLRKEDPPAPGQSFDERVLRAARVREPQRGRVQQAQPWRRATAALALAASLILTVWMTRQSDSPPVMADGKVDFEFVFAQPYAKQIALAGDFNEWNAEQFPMKQENGVWRLRVRLNPGVHQYQFVVDGAEWVTDPASPSSVEDGFGRRNSVLHVAPAQAL